MTPRFFDATFPISVSLLVAAAIACTAALLA